MNNLRKKTIGVTVVLSVLAILCTQSVAAEVYTWTNKPQYNLGEKGKLQISILNEYDEPVSIYNITIIYPWHVYDANEGKWLGNVTLKGESSILMTMTEKGTQEDHFYREAEFTVPRDGTAILDDEITFTVWTSKQQIRRSVNLEVAATSYPLSVIGLDMWMTSLIAAVVVCTIILAIVIFLATRGTRTSTPRIPASPRTKAE